MSRRTRNTKKMIFAIPAAAPAMPPKPSSAATSAIMRKVKAQPSMGISFRINMGSERAGTGKVAAGLETGGRREGVTFAPAVSCHQACKPGSVPLSRRWPFLLDAPCGSSRATNPGGSSGNETGRSPCRAAPTRSCSRWGLPCRPCYQERGALLPHPFTLTPPANRDSLAGRFAFCCTVPRVAPAGSYPAPCFRGARTFLSAIDTQHRQSGHPAC
jgi:hypothetical protein